MAFGKVRDGAVGSGMNLRQQMRRSTKRPARSTPLGADIMFARYLPPLTGKPDIVRLIPGSYETPRTDDDAKDFVRTPEGLVVTDIFSYYTFIEYYCAKHRKYIIGSEGPLGKYKGKGAACIAADWYWWEWRQRNRNRSKRPNTIQRKEKFGFTVLVEAPFYKVPQADDRGKIRENPTTGEPYYNWVKGSRKGNDEYAAADYERKDGHLMHWAMPYSQFAIVQEYADGLASSCSNCGGEDTINILALICRNCGEAVVEMATTSLDEEDLERMRSEAVVCPHCRHLGYLEEFVECTNCGDPNPATIYDYDLKVKRVETSTGDGTQNVLQIVGAIGPRPIPDLYGEDMRKPLDLTRVYAPTPLDKQEDILGLPPSNEDVMTDRQGSGSGRRRANNEDDDDEDTDDEDEAPRRQPVNRKSRSYR